MKKTFYLPAIGYWLLAIVFISGCQESVKKEKAVETTVKADSNFPQIMVGAWEADINGVAKSQWGIKFEPDGTIKKIIHPLIGPVNLTEGGAYVEGPDPNTYAVFTMGHCGAEYNKESRILKVKIVLDYYEMQLPTGKLQGKMEDNFWGKISDDNKMWNVKWVSYSWLEGAVLPDINEVNANPDSIVFKKIEIGNKPDNRNQ